MQEIHLLNLNCMGCVDKLKSTIAKLDPTAIVAIDLDAKSATIDSKEPRQTLIDALSRAGFEVAP